MIRPTKRQRVECPPSWLDCATLQTVPAAATTTTTIAALASADSPTNVNDGIDHTGDDDDTMIRTPLASATTLEIFMDRFRREVVEKYKFSMACPTMKRVVGSTTKQERRLHAAAGVPNNGSSGSGVVPPVAESALLSSSTSAPRANNDPDRSSRAGRIHSLLRGRIAVGLNESTRALQAAAEQVAREIQHATGSSTTDSVPVPVPAAVAPQPLLVVVTAEGMRPSPLVMSHLPVLARQLHVPLLLLPDCDTSSSSKPKSSSTRRSLGRLLGVKSASVLTFLSAPPSQEKGASATGRPRLGPNDEDDDNDNDDDDIRRANADLDSFVAFIIGKVNDGTRKMAPQSSTVRTTKLT